MSKLVLYSAICGVIAAFSPKLSYADDVNQVFLSQVGTQNLSGVAQEGGSDNIAAVTQFGERNNVSNETLLSLSDRFLTRIENNDVITQIGSDNIADIRQTSNDNDAIIYQKGSENNAVLLQHATGAGNRALQIQQGLSNSSYIEQNGADLYAESVQEDVNFGRISINQSGVGHRAVVYQTGGGTHTAIITQR